MKRILKLLFSRLFLVGFTIILLFILDVLLVFGAFFIGREAMIFFLPSLSEDLRTVFSVLQWLVVIVTVLHVVNRDMIPEAKIPWILCVVVLNVFGVMVYAVFSYNRPSKRQRRRYWRLREQSKQYAKRTLSKEETKAVLNDKASMSEAILRGNSTAVLYANTDTEYFPSGEAFFERLQEDLKRAEKFIFMEYFILARGKMWDTILEILKKKVKAGVEVRVIFDDIGCMGKLRLGYERSLKKAGISCMKFNPFVPIVSNLHNNRDHRKITVIDGKIGYTGGVNLADEYINQTHPFGYWKDTALRLEGEGVKGLTLMFLQTFHLRTKGEIDFSKYIPAEFEKRSDGFVQPYCSGPRPIYQRHLAEDVYINILASAREYVYITTPYLIIDYRMREAMCSAAARGVDVRIVVPHIPDKKLAFALTRSNYMALIKGGVKIYEFTPGFIHAKSFLSDDEIGVVGTVNLDYRSLMHHYENAVLMYKTKANTALKADFESIFERSALQTEHDAKKNVVWRGLCEVAKVFAPLF